MTEDKCNKAVSLYNERSKLNEILGNIESPICKLCFIEGSRDSMTWKENMYIREIKELHDILDTHHSLIIGKIKLRIEEISKEIESL
ncbi:hypothetical protein [Bacteroides sp.]|uniref:hypothetical protein n=1 Tax=Bacteroides sp. TaxID=29523 RepID=UPI00261EFDB6|nr:hypothetical protein [Bacteroides sp.]MDD3037899.1 hypothetical protein [Bacteroides sp.]